MTLQRTRNWHITVAKAPCKTCPYRRDVPSGVWAREEYAKLPAYDKPTLAEQIVAGGAARFDCHQSDGNLCAGWLGCHGAGRLAAIHLLALDERARIDDAVLDYKSPVPLFGSGAEAAAHGMKDIAGPDTDALRVIARLKAKALRKRAGVSVKRKSTKPKR